MDGNLEAFRQCVWDDPALQQQLGAVEDTDAFVRLVVESAQARGFQLPEHEVRDALRAARRAWHERLSVR